MCTIVTITLHTIACLRRLRQAFVLNARESAPAAATADMFRANPSMSTAGQASCKLRVRCHGNCRSDVMATASDVMATAGQTSCQLQVRRHVNCRSDAM